MNSNCQYRQVRAEISHAPSFPRANIKETIDKMPVTVIQRIKLISASAQSRSFEIVVIIPLTPKLASRHEMRSRSMPNNCAQLILIVLGISRE
jgi:hypothetical protein